MEMSHDYMRETVAKMTEHGFAADEEHAEVSRQGGRPTNATATSWCAVTASTWCSNASSIPTVARAYWLEVRRMGAIHTFPFPLDSWKWRDDQVEFSFYGRHDGSALSFVLRL